MGAPFGNQNGKKGRRWANAVERAVNAWPARAIGLDVNKGIDEAAYEFVSKMMSEKDIAFFREFGDRLDGKPAQAIIGDASEDAIQVATRVELVSL